MVMNWSSLKQEWDGLVCEDGLCKQPAGNKVSLTQTQTFPHTLAVSPLWQVFLISSEVTGAMFLLPSYI